MLTVGDRRLTINTPSDCLGGVKRAWDLVSHHVTVLLFFVAAYGYVFLNESL